MILRFYYSKIIIIKLKTPAVAGKKQFMVLDTPINSKAPTRGLSNSYGGCSFASTMLMLKQAVNRLKMAVFWELKAAVKRPKLLV